MKQGHDENSIYIMASHVGASCTPLQSTLSINSSGPNRFLFHLIEKVRLVFGYGGGGNKQILKNGASR